MLLLYSSLVLATPVSLEERIKVLEEENLRLKQENLILSGFTAYKRNYALLYAISSRDDDQSFPSEDAEFKFQLSFKQRLRTGNWGTAFLGYTQKSFWKVYDGGDSRPFRETNYNPEIFYRSPTFSFTPKVQYDIGFEHESNGAREPESRSWNRFYIKPTTTLENSSLDLLKLGIKIWYRLPEKAKETPSDPYGDENPDISHFYGNKELFIAMGKTDYDLSMMFRWNSRKQRGAQQIDFTFPLFQSEALKGHFQYWNGYGESLIDYNQHLTRFGLGIILVQ